MACIARIGSGDEVSNYEMFFSYFEQFIYPFYNAACEVLSTSRGRLFIMSSKRKQIREGRRRNEV